MTAYISSDINMVKELDPKRHELEIAMQAYLILGGTIEVLQGPSFQPPPKRYEPPRRKKAPKVAKPAPTWLDKIAQRDIEREERAAQRDKEKAERAEYVRKLAETMTYAEAVEHTGMHRRTLQLLAVANGFKFQPAIHTGSQNLKSRQYSEHEQAQLAERIKAFRDIGLSRHNAMGQIGMTFKTFARLLEKFNIDYPKCIRGPHPAFFPKPVKH